MKTVTSGELQRKFGKVQEMALREPVSITHRGRRRLVLLDAETYDALRQREHKAYRAEETPAYWLPAIAAAREDLQRTMQDDPLNSLLDDEYAPAPAMAAH